MKHFELAQQLSSGTVAKDVKKRASLSEQDIITLQDYFLTPGFHLVRVENQELSRFLLVHQLYSFYSSFAVLSTSEWSLPQGCHDLYKELNEFSAFSKKEAMQDYLLCSFQHDFLAIEGTPDLLRSTWFGRFEHLLIEYGIDRTVPVIIFIYE